MECTTRELGQLALALPAAALRADQAVRVALAQATRPNSLIDGVQIGTISYSYRVQERQSGSISATNDGVPDNVRAVTLNCVSFRRTCA